MKEFLSLYHARQTFVKMVPKNDDVKISISVYGVGIDVFCRKFWPNKFHRNSALFSNS